MINAKRYKLISIILVLLITLGSFLVGCGGKDKDTSDPDVSQSEKDNETKEKTDTEQDEKESADFKFAGYPMDAEDVTIKWWVGEGFTLHETYTTAEESPFHSGLIEHTGVNIDWQFPAAGTNATQALNLILASGDLPDIIYRANGTGFKQDVERYMEEDIVRDLTDYIEEYSPAYYKLISSEDIYERALKTDSGKYYGYGLFQEDGGWNATYQGPVIRQDWLDKLNLETPETISDWDDVINAFKNEFDAVLSFAWNRFRTTGISGAFGAYGAANYQLYIDDNNKVQLAQAQPEWKDYMTKLNEWWKAGLLDQDIMTMDDNIARTKALNEIMGISYTSMGQLTNWRSDAEEDGNGADWIGLQYPKGDDGTLSMVFGGYGVRDDIAIITTSCPDENLEIAMRLLDYAYTDEGHLYWNFGTKGVSWEYDENDEPAFTDLVVNDPDGLNDAIPKYSGTVWNGPAIQATKLLYLKNSEASIAANDLWFYANEEVTAKWKIPPGITLTVEESDRLDELVDSISTYVSEMAAKYITGEESLDNFDSFLEQLEKMKVSEVLEIQQAAYNRYLAR